MSEASRSLWSELSLFFSPSTFWSTALVSFHKPGVVVFSFLFSSPRLDDRAWVCVGLSLVMA